MFDFIRFPLYPQTLQSLSMQMKYLPIPLINGVWTHKPCPRDPGHLPGGISTPSNKPNQFSKVVFIAGALVETRDLALYPPIPVGTGPPVRFGFNGPGYPEGEAGTGQHSLLLLFLAVIPRH